MQIKTFKTRIFRENENLMEFIFSEVKKIPEGSILAVTSKIVALSEGRTSAFQGESQKIKLIKKESDLAFKTKETWLTVKDGMIMPSAGIDESNGGGKLVLLPLNSFRSAELIRKEICKKFKIKNFGVLITDSGLLPLRAGSIGVALGYAGFKGVRDYRGHSDIFGRILKISRTDVADSLASSVVLCMGEGKERCPLALITFAPIIFSNKVDERELTIDPKQDIYAPFLDKLNKQKYERKK